MFNKKNILHFLMRLILLASVGLVVLGFTGPIVALAAGPAPVNLLSAGDFAILAKTGITTTVGTHITGDIGVSPIDSTAITGFGLILDGSGTFSTSSLVTGKVYAADYAAPTPVKMTTAISDMLTAYNNAKGVVSPPPVTELGAGNIGGMTLAPGLYKWSTDVNIPTNLTLSGGASDVWIFQIAGDLNIASGGSVPAGVKVLLSGGAQASNVFWQVGGGTGATLATYSTFNGTILSAKQIILETGAVLNGKALAQTQVTLDANVVIDTSLTIIYVSSTGEGCDNCGGNTPCYNRIQEAIDSAVSGALIKVRQGTYPESILLNASKWLTLNGGWNCPFTSQTPNTTFIQAPGQTSIQAPSGSLTFQMLTIKP